MAISETRCNPSITIVVPLLNEAENLPDLLTRIRHALPEENEHLILFVDDGSDDQSLEIIKQSAHEDSSIRYLSLTRNFGHQEALKTGLLHCDTDVVISMDADLQHPPELISEMVRQWSTGFDVVNMLRKQESGSWFKSVTSKWYYRLISTISDVRIPRGSSDFRLLDRKVVDTLNQLPERCIFLRGLIPWLGYSQVDIEFEVEPRHRGKRKYNLYRMLKLAATGVTSSSTRPLQLSFFIGAVTATLAIAYAVYAVVVRLVFDDAISGWASILTGMMLLGGVQLMMLGVLGEYLGKVFVEVKRRPSAVILETNITSLELSKSSK